MDSMTLANKTGMRLRKEIQSGAYTIGQKLPSENALAKHFNIGRSTIRQALKILEDERLITRQHGRGTFVAYSNHDTDREKDTGVIGAMVYGIETDPQENYFFGDILRWAFPCAASRGYILATGLNNTAEAEDKCIDTFIKSGIKGAIIAPQIQSQPMYDRLINEEIQVVLLDSLIPGRIEDLVGVDNLAGMEMATKHLIELGHTNIVYMGHENQSLVRNQLQRYLGYVYACTRFGLEFPLAWEVGPATIKPLDAMPYDYLQDRLVPDDIVTTLHSFFDQENRPTAVVAFNDLFASLAIRTAQERGLKVPDDLSVVGFDDSSVSRDCDVPITSVNPGYQELGEVAVNLLIDKMESSNNHPKRTTLVTPKLVIRESTTVPPQK